MAMPRPKRHQHLMPNFHKPYSNESEGFDELNQRRWSKLPHLSNVADQDVIYLGTRKSHSRTREFNVKSDEKLLGEKTQSDIPCCLSKRQRIETHTQLNIPPQAISFFLTPIQLRPDSTKASDTMSGLTNHTNVVDKSPLDDKLIQDRGTSQNMKSKRGKPTVVFSFEDLVTTNIRQIQTEKRPLDHETLGSGVDIIEPVKPDEAIKCEVNADMMSLQERKKSGVSLVECFTEEEIDLHMKSLKEGSTQKEMTEETSDAKEEACQLCGDGKLMFPPTPLYCSSCNCRLKDNSVYYTTGEELSPVQHQICSSCYKKSKSKFLLSGVSILRANMLKKNNIDNQITEEWVQCESCDKWQHQICGLYNKLKDVDHSADYLCPLCLLKERKSINNRGFVDSPNLGAKGLPETIFSYFMEQRLFKRLKEERNQTAKATGKSINDVLEPEGLTLRVVLSADQISTVNKQFANLLHKENYPSEFPYRSKVILLFQKVEGVDILLFALFVQEFGSECSLPNQRSTYIAYLDSVKYFRPERVTFAGEALRTFVYHEILIGYLEYCKLRGFSTAYIWACPPPKGEDYIMYSHPKAQQTPNTKKLRQWYVSMLKKASEEKVVTNVRNLHERFFVSKDESICKTTARLPYFEGAFWSYNAEFLIQEIEKKDSNDIQKDVKSLFKRKRKSMSNNNTDCIDVDDAKNILLMQKLEKMVFQNKEDFMVVELNYSCTRCSKVILSGSRWFCDKCKNLQLCETCYDAEPERLREHTHNMNDKEKHQLSKVEVNSLPSTTEDNDIIQENKMFESRQAFLSFSQEHNYNFDTFRRAKHSSMMILHHLHTSNKDQSSQNSSCLTCNVCKKDISTKIYFPCLVCSDYRVCTECRTKEQMLSLLHLFPIFPSANGAPPRTVEVLEILNAIPHCIACVSTTVCKSCSYPKCNEVIRLFFHNANCKIREKECCTICDQFLRVIRIHAHHCHDLKCRVPHCRKLKEVLTGKVL